MNQYVPNCARCPIKPDERVCKIAGGKYPENCPTVIRAELAAEVLKEYTTGENAEFAKQASLQERDGYSNRELGYAKIRPAKSRIEEILDFIDKMNYRKIGMAFCMGLRKEAR